jgi:molecular chaperone GrpE
MPSNSVDQKDQTKAETNGDETTTDIEALRKELGQQKQRAEHNLDQWKRAEADLQNYRKRVEKERGELVKFGTAGLMRALLPTLDDLERALQTLPEVCHRLTWAEGMLLIERKLHLTLEREGLKEIEALGKSFDPSKHEALAQEETSAFPEGHVSAVLQRGYMLHDRVLRPAMVQVARSGAATTLGTVDNSSPAGEPKQGKSQKTEQ